VGAGRLRKYTGSGRKAITAASSTVKFLTVFIAKLIVVHNTTLSQGRRKRRKRITHNTGHGSERLISNITVKILTTKLRQKERKWQKCETTRRKNRTQQ
jgi:hypothetical protein